MKYRPASFTAEAFDEHLIGSWILEFDGGTTEVRTFHRDGAYSYEIRDGNEIVAKGSGSFSVGDVKNWGDEENRGSRATVKINLMELHVRPDILGNWGPVEQWGFREGDNDTICHLGEKTLAFKRR